MALYLKCNAVFLHIPKTGGSWVRKVLYDSKLVECEFSHEHADLERILHFSGHYPGDFLRKSISYGRNFEKIVNSTYKFTFIRHPVAWYVSTWSYMESIQWKNFIKKDNLSRFGLKYDTWHPFTKLYKHKSSDLNEFINNVIHEFPGFYSNLVFSYTGFDEIDYVGKQENLAEDLKTVLNILNVDQNSISLVSKKINPSPEAYSYLDKDLEQKILDVEYPVIKKYYS